MGYYLLTKASVKEERRGAFIEKTRDILFFVTEPKAEPHRFLTTDVPLRMTKAFRRLP